MSYPTQIKLADKDKLLIKWNDEKIHRIPLKLLRDESPDAGNKGETILWRHYDPLPPEPDKPGKYEIEKIETVGNYAISITWKDGYDYGIYPWQLLRTLGEYSEVKANLHQDFEHDHDNEHKDKEKK